MGQRRMRYLADLDSKCLLSHSLAPLVLCITLGLTLMTGCAETLRYNSLDLALLPCESGNAPIFFQAVEFDEHGEQQHAEQIAALRQRLESPQPVTDMVIFIHGWNKNPSSAELDYQNFICRLHGRLRNFIADEKREGGLLVLGLFWPSTITNRAKEPFLVKPVSYFQIRDRADLVAETGVAPLLLELIKPALERTMDTNPVRLHLIGHSFGGRMVIRALEKLQETAKLVPFLVPAEAVNVVLVNAALSPDRFEWINTAAAEARQKRQPLRFTQETASYLFNLHSFQDSANRRLFPLASLFNDDQAECAAGACGIDGYPTRCVSSSGHLAEDSTRFAQPRLLYDQLNTWNIDTTRIVFAHSDIYKGRVASLIADLLYDPEIRQSFSSVPQESRLAPENRCREIR